MIINHNISALNTYNRLSSNQGDMSKSLEKLSSGLRINRAGDDAAGLAISEKMRGQIRGLDQATRNSQDGISLIQTAEGALNESHSILQRMRELAVQAGNDTNTDADRTQIQKEVNQLTDELDRIASTTEFNTKSLLTGTLRGVEGSAIATMTHVESNAAVGLVITAAGTAIGAFSTSDTLRVRAVVGADGTATADISVSTALSTTLATGFAIATATGIVTLNGVDIGHITATNLKSGDTLTFSIDGAKDGNSTDTALRFQIGANTAQEITVGVNDMRAQALGIKTDTKYLDVSTQFGAEASISRIDSATTAVSTERSKLGAVQNRLEHTINNLTASSENLTAAESRIRDVNMAKEMMNYQKTNILSQAATAMLAQANQVPQSVLQLLK